MHAPQIIMLVMMGAGLLISANQHGEPRKNENFWITLLSAVVSLVLLYWGGFFN